MFLKIIIQSKHVASTSIAAITRKNLLQCFPFLANRLNAAQLNITIWTTHYSALPQGFRVTDLLYVTE